jgi:DNA polymerase II
LWAATGAGPLEIILNNVEPVMFLRRSALRTMAKQLPGTARVRDVALRTLDGEPVHAVYFRSQRSLERTRDSLLDRNVECLEADIPPAERFLMERFIRGSFSASGEPVQEDGFPTLVNPRLEHGEYRPNLAVLSFDIETSPDAGQLYSIAYICGETRRVLLAGQLDGPAHGQDFEVVACRDERGLLSRFIDELQALDPDVLIGWNVINFDLTVLQRRCRDLGIQLALGRRRATARVLAGRGGTLNGVARVPGRVVLDGIECLRSAFWTFESFALEAVSLELLGTGQGHIHGVRQGSGSHPPVP